MSKFIAIDLDPQGIYVVSGTARAGYTSVDSVLAWDGTEGEVPPALTGETAKHIGEQLRNRLRDANIAPGTVVVSIPRDRVILKELRYPAVPPTEEPSVVKFQAMKELTDAPEDVVLDYVPLSLGTAEGEKRSMAVAVRKDLYSAIQSMCEAAGLKLAAVTPRPYCVAAGLTRAFAAGTIPRPEGKDPVAIATLSPGGGEFTVIRPGATAGSSDVTFTRTIPAPSLASETEALAAVRRNLAMYAGANPGSPINALYVAEPEGRTVNRLKNSLGIAVHAYDPLSGVNTTVPEGSRGRFAGAVGLLAVNAAGEVPINFVEPRQPKIEADPKRKQILLAGLGMMLLVVVGIGIGLWVVDMKQNELAELQLKKNGLADDIATLEPDYKRLQAANAWQARRVVWLDTLYDTTDQFSHADGTNAVAFSGKAIPPDPKTGKQELQASVEIKITSHDTKEVNDLIAAMERDNTDPKKKYYVGVGKVSGGPDSSDPAAREYTVFAKVTNRSPNQYARFPAFPPPSRKFYPPAVAVKEPERKDADKEAAEKEAKEKDDPADEKDTVEPKDPPKGKKDDPMPRPKGKNPRDQ